MDLKLTDKCALVSGSTAGIDRAIAFALLQEGVRVCAATIFYLSDGNLSAGILTKTTGRTPRQ
jgi:hypothetical protein